MSFVAESFQQALDLVWQADGRLWRIVALSLAVSGSATLLGGLLGVPAGAALAVPARALGAAKR